MRPPAKILIRGDHRNALTVARRLGVRHQIVLGMTGGTGRVDRSRFVTETWTLPNAKSDRFADALESLLHQIGRRPVVVREDEHLVVDGGVGAAIG